MEVQLQKTLYNSVYASLFVQVLTGVIDMYVLQKHHYTNNNLPTYYVNPNDAILPKLLWMELIVQIVEGAFYIWFASSFAYIKNVTPNRYFDWAITTPTMLLTLCLYLNHLKHYDHDEKERKDGNIIQKPPQNIVEGIQQQWTIIVPVIILNWAMLAFGYLGEVGILSTQLAVSLGFIPFVLYFWMIYNSYAKYSRFGSALFYAFAGIWSFYGLAALMSYYWKNIAYNILDLFAKNFFGLFLAYVVWSKMG
jgi:hypothetical protein